MPKKPLTTFENDNATNEWLDKQKRGTRNTYRSAWRFFLKYVGMTGDEILARRKEDLKSEDINTQRHWENVLLDYQKHLKEKGDSPNHCRLITSAIRSFFNFHYSPMKFRRTETSKLTGDKSRVTSDYKFTKDELYKMYQSGDLIDKYIITVGKSFGLRAGDFIELTRGHFEPYIDREVPIEIGVVYTQKRKAKAFPFVDQNARPIIKLMLKKMNVEGRTDPKEKMLTFGKTKLTLRLQRMAKRIGIKNGSKSIRFHVLRSFLIDRLSMVASESKWKQIVGKSISEGAYVSTLELRELYKKVLDQTSFSRNGNGRITNLQKVLSSLEDENGILKSRINELQKRSEKQQKQIDTLEDHLGQFSMKMIRAIARISGGKLEEWTDEDDRNLRKLAENPELIP